MRLLLVLLALFGCANALKFLMYNPKSSKSHVGFVNNVADALIDAGLFFRKFLECWNFEENDADLKEILKIVMILNLFIV